jgi:hemolysin III
MSADPRFASLNIPEEYLVEHYPTRAERLADGWIHGLAIAAALVGGAVLVGMAGLSGRPGLVAAAAVYAAALVAMLACSAVYNLTHVSPARPFLRRLDEAAIFLMIAASYTPFTTQRLTGAWSLGMTGLVWALAAAGIAGKLLAPQVSERVWTAGYVAFGWLAVVALGPMIAGVPAAALALLLAGGLVYTAGSLLFLRQGLRFRRAIWHGCVVGGAAIHYSAILSGVVLQAGPLPGAL